MSERTDSNERPARLQLAGQGGGTWRERLAAKEAGRGTSPAPAAEEAPPRRPGGYVPPALRDGGRSSSRGAQDGNEVRQPPPDTTPKPATPLANNIGNNTASNSDAPKGGKWVPPQLRKKD